MSSARVCHAFGARLLLRNAFFSCSKRAKSVNYVTDTRLFSTSTVVSAQRLDVSGVYPPIPTPFNPDESESISLDKLKHNLQKWEQIPFRGYVVQGSNAEFVYLSREEQVLMVSEVRKAITKDKLVIAGSGCESTRDTITMSRKMADVGADAVLVVPPCFYKASMTPAALINHYTKVADASPVPVILYNVPSNTGLELPADAVIQLAQHDNIIALKDSGGDVSRLGDLVYKTKDYDFQVLAGSAGFLTQSYLVGCVGGVMALANVLGGELCRLHTLYWDGRLEQASLLQQRVIAPNACVTRRFGISGMKQAMDWFGYYGGPTRSPLIPLTDQQTEVMRQTFRASGFL